MLVQVIGVRILAPQPALPRFDTTTPGNYRRCRSVVSSRQYAYSARSAASHPGGKRV
jgi:hypothetical protein